MTKLPDHFPPEIRSLAAFEGPFDAHRLPAVPAGVDHGARFQTDSAEIEFWFTP